MSIEKPQSQNNIPTSKVQRAAKFVKTGAKVGRNYVKHYAKKAVNPNLDRSELDNDNAQDIYDALSNLKGSALKVAQMMSMDKNMLPTAYTEKFTMAQYSAPPLSYPLVVKTFQKYFQQSPTEMFDTFTKEAVNAASIGQVHQATKNGQKLAVKVQYPGVADSIDSDLKMVKPFAIQLLGLSEADLEVYMSEVRDMLVSETDYTLELKRSMDLTQKSAHIKNLRFAQYFPELSSERILTMAWLEGEHLDKFLAKNPSQEVRNQIGQALWDFYDFQMHQLKEVHADPHPGNFLLKDDGTVGVIDFGCVKEIPEDYYQWHFQVIDPEILNDEARLTEVFYNLRFIMEEDTPRERELFTNIFREMIQYTIKPFRTKTFDFGDDEYFNALFEFGERLSKNTEVRKAKRPRGKKDSLYLNRAYFGLYSILHDLRATVETRTAWFKK